MRNIILLLTIATASIQCAHNRHSTATDSTTATATAADKAVAALTPQAKALEAQMLQATPAAPAVATATAAHASDPHHKEAHPGVPATTALKWLTNGNARYTKAAIRKDGQTIKDIERLSTGQHPHAIVVSCSDSRVPPEIVFDQKLGEIFTVRTAGQSLDSNSIGSIEYAVEHLGSRLIVVMGHTSCGAVKAAYDTMGGASAGSPHLDSLVKDIHPRIAKFKNQPTSTGMEKESWANAEGVANDLLARSKILSERWAHGDIMIVPSLYDLKTGRVTYHEALRSDGARTPSVQH